MRVLVFWFECVYVCVCCGLGVVRRESGACPPPAQILLDGRACAWRRAPSSAPGGSAHNRAANPSLLRVTREKKESWGNTCKCVCVCVFYPHSRSRLYQSDKTCRSIGQRRVLIIDSALFRSFFFSPLFSGVMHTFFSVYLSAFMRADGSTT